MIITTQQSVVLVRAVVLISRWGDCLAPFEHELLDSVVDRFRSRGASTTLTANEWRVIEESVAGMEAARDDADRAAKRAAQNASGVA